MNPVESHGIVSVSYTHLVEKVDRWGKRRLAYAVKKFTDGFYVLINFEAAPAEIKEIDRVLKINDEVLRPVSYTHLDVYKRQDTSCY